jgi:two-component system response regulator FixJ
MVVIIDDDEAMRHSLEWLIASAGHAVLGYASARDYLDDGGRDGNPDCVILDVHMPEINGLEMYGILKDRHPDLAVIFITGYPDQTLAEQARNLDATRFFTKPLDTDAILNCIDELIGTP